MEKVIDMLVFRDFVMNQHFKHEGLNLVSNPENFYFFSFGHSFLCIKKNKDKYCVCGLNTGIKPLFVRNNYEVYYIFDSVTKCIDCFSDLVKLLMEPRCFISLQGELGL